MPTLTPAEVAISAARHALDHLNNGNARSAAATAAASAIEAKAAVDSYFRENTGPGGIAARTTAAAEQAAQHVERVVSSASLRAKQEDAVAAFWCARRAWAHAALVLGLDAKRAAEAWQAAAQSF